VRTNEIVCACKSESDRSYMCVVDVKKREVIRTHHMSYSAERVCFSADGKWLALSESYCIQLLDASEKGAYAVKRRLKQGLRGFGDAVAVEPFADFSPDSRWFLVHWDDLGLVSVHVVDDDGPAVDPIRVVAAAPEGLLFCSFLWRAPDRAVILERLTRPGGGFEPHELSVWA